MHRDFTAGPGGEERPLVDEFGHGTHVAGIIAGELTAARFAAWAQKQGAAEGAAPAGQDAAAAAPDAAAATVVPPAPAEEGAAAPDAAAKPQIPVVTRRRSEQGEVAYETSFLPAISGMAPRCKLVSLKVLDAAGRGRTSNIIAAIEQVQEINGFGRRLRIHGVNLSVGYDFEPEWFACGQSPLCVEVDRLVRSGVVVVVAAGNTGYGVQQTKSRGPVATGMDLSINDPGNAELAITVGSTHRDMPHVYGVSYFSSKGPTGDGRLKPDLVAPGEKIVSCAAGSKRAKVPGETSRDFQYVEDSGTSMAAPHVSGVIAAFLSVRQEFIGNPEAVKQIFLSTATDLKRDRYFQGNGLVDLMRAIQSV
jgi:subtilisin family serine protease